MRYVYKLRAQQTKEKNKTRGRQQNEAVSTVGGFRIYTRKQQKTLEPFFFLSGTIIFFQLHALPQVPKHSDRVVGIRNVSACIAVAAGAVISKVE